MAPHSRGLRPSRLWTSDLARASQTAAYIGVVCGLQPEPDPRLREFSVGERAGLTRAQFEERFPREYAAWLANDEECQVPGSETTADVLGRMVPALRSYVAELQPGGLGLVVSHGACLRASLLEIIGLPQSADAALGSLANCSWTTLQEVEPGGPLRLMSYNVTAPGTPDADDDGDSLSAPHRADFASAQVVG